MSIAEFYRRVGHGAFTAGMLFGMSCLLVAMIAGLFVLWPFVIIDLVWDRLFPDSFPASAPAAGGGEG